MPEGLEVEIYRGAAERLAGRTVVTVHADDRLADPGLCEALRGVTFEPPDRVGKWLLLRSEGPTLGIHFGMTGRLVVDGVAPIETLEYGSGRDDGAWDRLVVELSDGGLARVNDPRRWARFTLDPDTSRFGPDLLSVGLGDLRRVLGGSSRAAKAVLLDQHAVAGLGNMCVDEVLWHAAVAPLRPGRELDDETIVAIHRSMRGELAAMLERGGSHTGVLSPAVRASLPGCPRDGAGLARARVAGRTTVWCPAHQR